MICACWKNVCKSIEQVDGYEVAKSSSKRFVLHHRLETHFSDGTPRPKSAYLRSEELKALGMYYDRPPEELIIMTHREHRILHNADECRLSKMRETMNSESYQNSGMWKKGQETWNKGRPCDYKNKVKESVRKNPEAMGGKAKRLREAYLKDDKGLSWNEFQHKYKNNY